MVTYCGLGWGALGLHHFDTRQGCGGCSGQARYSSSQGRRRTTSSKSGIAPPSAANRRAASRSISAFKASWTIADVLLRPDYVLVLASKLPSIVSLMSMVVSLREIY
jgi:hypothetical protein